MSTENKEFCNQCPNHCPITDLKCPRGRRALLGEEQGDGGRGECGGRGEHGRHGGHGEHGRHGEHGEHGRHGGRGEHGSHDDHHHGHGRAIDEDNLESLMHACGHFLHHRGRRGGGQEGILQILEKKDHMSQKELQEILQIQPGSLSEVLMKLEQKGLIIREKDDDDKRKSILHLTDAGKEALKEKNPRMEEKQLFDVLNEEEQTQLKKLLKKLLDYWKK